MTRDSNEARRGAQSSAPRRISASEVSSLVAVAISFFALALGLYQTHVMQGQARASVWPVLDLGYSFFDTGERAGFTWQVSNHGVGPAKLKSVIVRVDGTVVLNWDAVLKRVLGKSRSDMHDSVYSNLNGIVLPPDSNRDTTVEPIKLVEHEDAAAFLKARDRIDMEVCYCSVYEDCWVARWRKTDVVAVDRCERKEDQQFKD